MADVRTQATDNTNNASSGAGGSNTPAEAKAPATAETNAVKARRKRGEGEPRKPTNIYVVYKVNGDDIEVTATTRKAEEVLQTVQGDATLKYKSLSFL